MPKKKARKSSKSQIRLLDAKGVFFKGPFLALLVVMFVSMGVLFVLTTYAATVGQVSF